jgi:glycosyltransferase involved in cell wall biosynthesis
MIQLSVSIITFNEEKNIGRCLDSVKEIADDIVVVDSFSKDRTEEICRAKGVRFIQHAFLGHIEQKNWAIEQARFPHVLSIDADEEISDELRKSIMLVKNNWVKDGYYMNRLTNYCGKWIYHCGWYPDRKLRLWDSRLGKFGGVNPHDKYEMTQGDKVTGFLHGDILHYSYATKKEHYRQVDYFTGIASSMLFKDRKRVNSIILYLSPLLKFIRDYILKLGFLDGSEGFSISRISAYATYLKYRKLKNLWIANSK